MIEDVSFGQVVKDHRNVLGLTQTELARRVGCAAITIRKIEAGDLRPSVQMAELIALALNIPDEEQLAFVRLARADRAPSPIPTPSPAPDEIGMTDLSGRAVKGFQLGEKIGSGGFGVVYQALQSSVERDVAVKIILPRYANHPNFIRRFEAEAQLIARLEHPYIVPLYDYWREPDVAYLIMRLLRGGSLQDQLRSGPISVELVRQYMHQIGAALDVAHRNSVIHRDIKPANVLLDEEANAYLADFGIAKNLEGIDGHSLSDGSALIGSPAYISPEQIKAEPVKPPSDIYCLGVMLYEMLTGVKPFAGPTPIAFIQQHLNESLPSLQEHNPDLPPDLDLVIRKATAKDAADRFQDVPSLLMALERAWTMEAGIGAPLRPETPIVELGTEELAALDNPYKGLRAFGEADADQFYGRATLIQELFAKLSERSDLARFLAIVGPSGGGKSSVAKAGLVPALRRGGLPGSENWFVLDFTPGAYPWEEIEAALLRVAVNPPESLLGQLQEGDRGLLRAVQRILPDDGETELVLVIDQFEEVFTLVEDEAIREQFLNNLVTAVLDDRSRLRVVITLRADFYDRPLQYVDFGDLMRQRTVSIVPLTPDELEQAIVKPAAQLGVRLEPGLAATIIGDVGEQPGTLPLMQYALTELFEQRDRQLMTRSSYQEAGGVAGALARRADEIFSGLDKDGQAATRQLFLRLVTLGEGESESGASTDTRRRIRLSEVEALQTSEFSENGDTLNRVIGQFGHYRLLTFDHDPITRQPTVEVAHEALLREWGLLQRWLTESRDDIRRQRQLAVAAAQWENAEKDESYLLHGNRLTEFAAWAELAAKGSAAIALTKQEQAFLDASIEARQLRQDEEEARRQRELETARQLAETERKRAEEQTQAAQRLRRRALFLVGALAVAAFLAIAAIVAGRQATQNANQAQDNLALAVSREAEAVANLNLAATQEALAQQNVELAATREIEALHSAQIAETREAEAQGEALARAEAEAEAIDNAAEAQNVALISGSQASLANNDGDGALALAWQAVALNPDSALAQTQLSKVALGPGTVRRLVGHAGAVVDAAISLDGHMMLSASDDNTLIQWDLETGDMVRRLEGHTSWVNKVAISPNGKTAVSASEDGTVASWDLQTGQMIHQFRDYEGPVSAVAFDPEGQSIIAGGRDDDLALIQWDIETGQVIRRYEGQDSGVQDIEFTSDGSAVLSASSDGVLNLWDSQTGELIREMNPELGTGSDALWVGAISPDGSTAIAGFGNSGILLWNLENGELIQRYPIDGGALAVAFHPDNGKVLVGNTTGAMVTLDLETGEITHTFTGHNDAIMDIAITPDGRYAVSASLDKTLRLWELENGQVIRRLSDPGELVFEVDLSPDEHAVLSGSNDGAVTVWSLADGEVIRRFMNDQPVMAVTYSPDGKTALFGTGYRFAQEDEPGQIILWDVATGEEIRRFVGHPYVVFDVEFSPDGKQAVSSGSGAVVILWDVDTGQEIWRFDNYFVDSPWPIESFWDVEFHPDGRTILASYAKGPLIAIDAATGEEIDQLVGHIDSGATGITFSADGQRVVSGGWDAQAILWDMQSGDIIHRFTNHASSVGQIDFTPDERLMLGGSGDGTNSLWDVESGEVIRHYGNGFGIKPVFTSEGTQALVGFHDGSIELWRIDRTLDELLEWTQANRYIPELTCEQRELYHVEPPCEAED